ncbi:MAG: hypothetical protein GY820_42480, partial [Gammaproteobacteria bacterium]|nr:hypothetical protein [Gammaproteobacteria bacterium]
YRGRFPRGSRGGGYRGRRGGPRRGFDFEFRRGGRGQSFGGGWREEYGSYKDYMQQPEEQEGEKGEGQGVPEPTEGRPDDDEEEEQAEQGTSSAQQLNVADTKALTRKLHSAEEDEEDDEWADDPEDLLTVPTTPEALAKMGIKIKKNWKPFFVSQGFMRASAKTWARAEKLEQYKKLTEQ